jgi:hypothetical protein
MHPRRTPFVLLVCLALVAAACSGGGGDERAETTTSTTEAATTTTAPPPLAPLTGLPIDPVLLGRPAVVVKLDNVEPKARRQAALLQADVVYEERVEGSVTRLLAVFQSEDAAPVGPVRSARTSDIGIFSPLGRPYFAWSGANRIFAQRIRAANVVDVGYDAAPGQYHRDPGRPAPSNLMLRSTVEVRGIPAEGQTAPPALFTYRPVGQAPAGEPVAAVGVSYGNQAGSAPVEYRWNGTGWDRFQNGTPHVDASGVQVSPPNVVIQFVDYVGSEVTDQFGKPIPEAQLLGEGEVWVLTGGNLVTGRWHKPSLEAVTTYSDAAGQPIGLTPGRTWVALPSPGGAVRR